MFSVTARRGAQEAYLALNEADQGDVDRLVGLLRLDPWIDGVHKFQFASEVIILSVYDNDIWVIVYRINENDTTEIWAIERADPARRTRREY